MLFEGYSAFPAEPHLVRAPLSFPEQPLNPFRVLPPFRSRYRVALPYVRHSSSPNHAPSYRDNQQRCRNCHQKRYL